jgi:hypothetical protein
VKAGVRSIFGSNVKKMNSVQANGSITTIAGGALYGGKRNKVIKVELVNPPAPGSSLAKTAALEKLLLRNGVPVYDVFSVLANAQGVAVQAVPPLNMSDDTEIVMNYNGPTDTTTLKKIENAFETAYDVPLEDIEQVNANGTTRYIARNLSKNGDPPLVPGGQGSQGQGSQGQGSQGQGSQGQGSQGQGSQGQGQGNQGSQGQGSQGNQGSQGQGSQGQGSQGQGSQGQGQGPGTTATSKAGTTKATTKAGTTKATTKAGTTKATTKAGTTKATTKAGTTKATTKPSTRITTRKRGGGFTTDKLHRGGVLELIPDEPVTGNLPARGSEFKGLLQSQGISVKSVGEKTQGGPGANGNSTGNPLNPDGNKAFPFRNLLQNPAIAIEVMGEQIRGMTAQINEAPSPITHMINDQESVTYYEFAIPGPGGAGLRLFRIYIPTGSEQEKMAKVIQIRDGISSDFQQEQYVKGPAGLQQIIGDTRRVLQDQSRTITSAQGYVSSYKAAMSGLDEGQKRFVNKLIPVLTEVTRSDQASQIKLMTILNEVQAELRAVTA